jgi:phytoene synthase
VSGAEAVADAYRSCEAVTREQAGNFFYGIRLLPAERRRAMCAIYAFARRVDDIGDGALERDEKLARLDAQERSLEALGTDAAGADDPVVLALADARARFAFPASALSELIEGVRMDVDGATYDSFEQLVPYCRRVAGAIGRVCLPVFGLRADARVDPAQAEALADDLGVAMQLTNILRDVREDADHGRVYIPAEDLLRFGADLHRHDGNFVRLMRFEAQRARDYYKQSQPLIEMIHKRSRPSLWALIQIYHRLLERIERSNFDVLERRISLPAWEKLSIVARAAVM